MSVLVDDPKQRGILVVDDDLTLLNLLSETLGSAGYEKVYSASNGTDALSTLSSHSEDIHLVLLDLKMPGMDGISLVKHLSNVHIHPVGIVIVTGYSTVDSAVDFFNSANETVMACDFIAKPFSLEDILKEVNLVLDRVYKKRREFVNFSSDGIHKKLDAIEKDIAILPSVQDNLKDLCKRNRGMLGELGMDLIRALVIAIALIAFLYFGIGDFVSHIMAKVP